MVGNHLWNAARVRNFVKELNGKPTKWEENISFLAANAEMSVNKFLVTDPISYGINYFEKDSEDPHMKMQRIMGHAQYMDVWIFYKRASKAKSQSNLETLYEETVSDMDITPEVVVYDCSILPPAEVGDKYQVLKSDTTEDAMKKFDAFFLDNTANKKYSVKELAELKVKVADSVIHNLQTNDASIEIVLVNKTPAQRIEAFDRAMSNMQAWKNKAVDELNEMHEMAAITEYKEAWDKARLANIQSELEWECSICTAVWPMLPSIVRAEPKPLGKNEWSCYECSAIWKTSCNI